MERYLSLVLCLAGMLVSPPTAYATTLVSDDFESAPLNQLPPGWNDVGLVPGAAGNAVSPSAVVVSTTDAFGNPTQAVSIVDDFADSQGIYFTIPDLPVVGLSVDVRVDRRASVSTNSFRDWPWDITLSQVGSSDLSLAPAYGIFADAISGALSTFVQGYSGGTDDASLGASIVDGTWYNVNLLLDRNAGTIETVITDIATGVEIVNSTQLVTGWMGFAAEPSFNAVAILDGELDAITASNLVVWDNFVIADEGVPITLPPQGGPDGDLDGDGDVDMDDLMLVVSCFGQTAPLAPPCDAADVAPPPDGDGVINILDVSFVGSSFTP